MEGCFVGRRHLGEFLEAPSLISSPCEQGALRGQTCYGCILEYFLWREVEREW
jgi:hypothetical protein